MIEPFLSFSTWSAIRHSATSWGGMKGSWVEPAGTNPLSKYLGCTMSREEGKSKDTTQPDVARSQTTVLGPTAGRVGSTPNRASFAPQYAPASDLPARLAHSAQFS